MSFTRVRLYRYRNLKDADIDVDAPEVFLIGENGQGKTNFLESIYLLCFGSSFRSRIDTDLIRHGESEMSLIGTSTSRSVSPVEVTLKIRNRKKTIATDGKSVTDRKELIERFPCIVFCHEDIDFVSGAPDRRRWFFNQTMSLNTPLFVDTLRRYNRIISMRNAAIREGRDELLSVYDAQSAAAGLEIQEGRTRTVEHFNETFTRIFSYVSGIQPPVRIRYLPSWKKCSAIDDVVARFRERRETDRIMQTTTSGPHRDRFVFVCADKDFARTASTGQLRLLSLVLRVSQAVHFTTVSSTLPLLLLDDVLLELDGEKRRRFIEMLPKYEQAFFTFLPDERYDRYRSEKTMLYRVADGVLEGGGSV
jgi:DNA replication and repair protein RecF